MIASVTFAQMGDFSTDPDELARQVGQLQQNVYEAFVRLCARGTGALVPTGPTASDVQLRIHELVTVDTASGNRIVTMPVATPALRGATCGVIRPNASSTLTLAAPPVTMGVTTTVQGGATYAGCVGVGLWIFVCDGAGWWT